MLTYYHWLRHLYTKPDRIRDWITIPKANGYEALHTTVMGPKDNGSKCRSGERMDEIDERGLPHITNTRGQCLRK